MGDIFDYLKWRGDLSFAQDSLNEADHLVFAILSYVNMDTLDSEGKTIAEICALYRENGIDQKEDTLDPLPVLEACASSERFRNVIVNCYESSLDESLKKQFCAMLFRYQEDSVYLSFRGTDSTFTGWQEDFNMSARADIPARTAALDYAVRHLSGTSSHIVTGGHSKGGNLAQYAAMHCPEEIFERISLIVSLDGPGFRPEAVRTERFDRAARRTVHYLPEESIIGQLMENPVPEVIVRCAKSLFDQHDPYTWQITGPSFERAEKLSGISEFIRTAIDKWLMEVSDAERREFIRLVFSAIDASGARKISEFTDHPFNSAASVITALRKADRETQAQASAVLARLAQASSDTFWEAVREKFIPEKEQD